MSVLTPVIDRLDLSTKLIYLLAGTREYHPVSDIYVEIRNIRRLDESMRIFDTPVTAFGGVAKGGGKYTSRYSRFNNGWKVVPEDITHSLYVTGEQITDDGQSGPACIDTTPLSAGTSVIIQYEPPASELVKAADELAAIKRMAFDNRVAVDAENTTGKATSSIEFPAGTRQAPAIDIETALAICAIESYGFKELFLESDLAITGEVNLNGFIIQGNNHVDTVLTIDTAALVENLRIVNCTLDNTTLDGNVDISHSLIGSITYLNGHIHDSGLMGTMILDGNKECVLANCYTVDQDNPAIIDMGGSGNDLSLPNYSGIIYVRNLQSDSEEIGIGINAGMVVLEDTITAGNIIVAGNGILIDNTSGTAIVNSDALINQENIARAVWDEPIANHLIAGSTGLSMGRQQYNGVVHISTTGTTGETTFPAGTESHPVADMASVMAISARENITVFHVLDNYTITGGSYSMVKFQGRGRKSPYLTFDGTTLVGVQFSEIELTGNVASGSIIGANFCTFDEFSGARISAYECVFEGDISLGSGESNLYRCTDGVPGIGIPDIQVGPCDSLGIWDWNGGIRISNISTPDTVITCMISEGRLWVDETCVEGDIIVKGNADLRGTTGGTTIDKDGLMTADTIAEYTWKATTKDVAVSINGQPGTDYPQGRPGVPINNMTDAKVVADYLGVHTYIMHEPISLEEDISDSVFNGHTSVTHDIMTIDGYNVSGCKFILLTITGTFGASSNDNDYLDCFFSNIVNAVGTANNTALIGTIVLGGAGTVFSTAQCYFAGDVTFEFTGASTLQSHYVSGQAIITNMGVGAVGLITADTTGNLTIDASCTGGTLVVRGNTTIIDNSGGAVTVIDQTQTIDISGVAEEVWSYERS